MKVIFVGIHNKPNKSPLCSTTRSGKIIDRIIEKLPDIECIKTNLYDVDYMPKESDKKLLVQQWAERVHIDSGDLIVILGNEVYDHYHNPNPYNYHMIKACHPSSLFGNAEIKEYIDLLCLQIRFTLDI